MTTNDYNPELEDSRRKFVRAIRNEFASGDYTVPKDIAESVGGLLISIEISKTLSALIKKDYEDANSNIDSDPAHEVYEFSIYEKKISEDSSGKPALKDSLVFRSYLTEYDHQVTDTTFGHYYLTPGLFSVMAEIVEKDL